MATAFYDTIVPPTPEQNQIVDYVAKAVDANALSYYIQPGFFQGVRNSYRLLNYTIYLLASAAAANRTITVTVKRWDKAASLHTHVLELITGNIAASESGLVQIGPAGALSGLTDLGATVIGTAQLNPEGIYLSGDDYISVVIGSVQAGDVYNIGAQFEYQNHIRGIKQ